MRKLGIIILLMFSLSPFLVPSYAQINNQRIPASATETIYLGPLEIQMTYSMDIDITTPKKITAGETEELRITPSHGRLDTTFFFNGDTYGPYSNPMDLGEEKYLAIDVPILNVYAKPEIIVYPKISGPADISPVSLPYNSTSTKSAMVFVNEDIGTSNSVELQIPITLFLEVGAELDVLIASQTYPVETFEIKEFVTISNYIPIEKLVYTTTKLEIENTTQEHIKVKPSVSTDSGMIYDYSVNIYVDDNLEQTVQSSRWSGDIFVGYGKHSVKAEFIQTQDQSNPAIIYLESVNFESILLKDPEKSPDYYLECEPGTHVENGQCVGDGWFGGGCLIATATYDSELAPQVQILRELRDNSLLQTESGTAFMNTFNEFYYSFSPAIADYERENPIFKEAVRIAITPMISSLSILNNVEMDSEEEVLAYGISLILLNIGMYIGIPIAGVYLIKFRANKK